MKMLIEKVYKTKASLPYMVNNFTAAQKSGCTIADDESNIILDYAEISGIISDKYFEYFVDLYTNTEELSVADGATMVYYKYLRWLNGRRDGILRAWEALQAEYNPIHNYDRYEDGYTDSEDITHGKKTSHATDIKASTNTDFKNSTATDIKAATASDIKSAVNTNIVESETLSTKKDIRPTWAADNQTTAKEETTPGTKTTSGTAQNNYTNTSGSANNNYTTTTGDVTKNYNRSVGVATDNYTQTVGHALNNYEEESGTTGTEREYGEKHMYGNIGVTTSSEMVEQELNLRKIDFREDLIREFVYSISYYVGGADDEY